MKAKISERVDGTNRFCSGCVQGIMDRIMAEVFEELGVEDKVVFAVDVACGCNNAEQWNYDTIVCAHGRPIPTIVGVSKVRPETVCIAHLGDGAAYSIGMAELQHGALRNNNIITVIMNNGNFGMTGGQMSPTSLIGQKTTSSPKGRDPKKHGNPFHVEESLKGMDIAYLGRGALNTMANINKTKKMFKKCVEKNLNKEGFCVLEVLTNCPTNWGLSPVDSLKRITEVVEPLFPVGEFIDKGGDK